MNESSISDLEIYDYPTDIQPQYLVDHFVSVWEAKCKTSEETKSENFKTNRIYILEFSSSGEQYFQVTNNLY